MQKFITSKIGNTRFVSSSVPHLTNIINNKNNGDGGIKVLTDKQNDFISSYDNTKYRGIPEKLIVLKHDEIPRPEKTIIKRSNGSD